MLALEVCVKGSQPFQVRKRHIGSLSLEALLKLKKLLRDSVEGFLIH
jgi:hypothetical protein